MKITDAGASPAESRSQPVEKYFEQLKYGKQSYGNKAECKKLHHRLAVAQAGERKRRLCVRID